MRHTGNRIGGSNPSLSASHLRRVTRSVVLLRFAPAAIGCWLSLPRGATGQMPDPARSCRQDGAARYAGAPFSSKTAMCPAGVGASKSSANRFSPLAAIMVCDLVARRHSRQSLDPDDRRAVIGVYHKADRARERPRPNPSWPDRLRRCRRGALAAAPISARDHWTNEARDQEESIFARLDNEPAIAGRR
jgi:hypothetical protein